MYKHILEDFDFAAANLPKEWSGADDARITKGGALAMKARAALSQNDWKVARDAAKSGDGFRRIWIVGFWQHWSL